MFEPSRVVTKVIEDKVRVAWDDELQEWFFSVVDAVEVLTGSKDPKDYLKKMRKREPELDAYVGTNCPLVSMLTPTGKHRKTLAANAEHLFRIKSIEVRKGLTDEWEPMEQREESQAAA